MKNNTLTIGIPAFNEEVNIGYLLEDLLKQKISLAKLSQVIVISDGSTDQTVNTARQVKGPKGLDIMIVQHKVRKGRAERQNEIMKISQADVLVLVDADIMIKKDNFIDQLIKPIISRKAELTSARVREIEEKSLLGKILASSMVFKRELFESVNKGHNLYTCHGRARAFGKVLYKQINFRESVGEDAYSYLYSKSCGFTYQFVKNAEVFYKLPATFKDHEKQSVRFYNTQKMFEKEFGKDFISQENYLNTPFIIKSFMVQIVRNPYLLMYVLLASYLKAKSLFKTDFANEWAVSQSSKNVRGVV